MAGDMHFISGLPRSGSTLLSALLRQNPRLHAGMSSPVLHLVSTLMRAMSQEHAASVFIEDEQRLRILRSCADGYYAGHRPHKLVFDTSRGWCAHMSLLVKLWPQARVVCCVRNPAWVVDSVERLVRTNALEPSGIFGYTTDGTVYSRTDGLLAASGMIGFAANALREAVFGAQRDRLLLVRYETLTTDPQRVMDAIYDHVGEPRFTHDFMNIEPDYEAVLFDARMGTEGLHAVGGRVRAQHRPTILPPDLFSKYVSGAFWDTDGGIPDDVKCV